MERAILHLDLDTFFVSVERLIDSSLNNKPVIVGGLSDRGVVASCSYEARKYGVHSAMPIKMARQLCPDAIFRRGSIDEYSKYSHMVTEIIQDAVPLCEKASIDEHYVDLTGMDRFFGTEKLSHELRQTIIKETGLPISFGLSGNKTVSKIATGEAKPNGEKIVHDNEISQFLYPLSIQKIPGVGLKTYRLLRSMGVDTIATLAQIPPEMLRSVLGQNGLTLWKKANGIDPTPIQAYTEQKSMSSERTFERDTADPVFLKQVIISLVEKLAFEMRQKDNVCSVITIKIRYSDFDTFSMQKKITYTAIDQTLIQNALDLFAKVYTKRQMLRLVGIRFSGLVNGAQQLSLFDDSARQMHLILALDQMRSRYGAKSLGRAISYRYQKHEQEETQE
jgi:DNA polymerase-4